MDVFDTISICELLYSGLMDFNLLLLYCVYCVVSSCVTARCLCILNVYELRTWLISSVR